MAKVFLTGATGYIGGDFLYAFANSKLKNAQLTCLVRNKSKEDSVRQVYPEAQIVHGELDDVELIEEQASKADVVVHLAATGHLPSSQAIARGLSSSSRTSPGYWIQMSGASLLAGAELAAARYGEPPEASYSDTTDISTVLSIIRGNPKRVVDNLVLSQDANKVKTALIAGPCIYGVGRGPGNTRTIQAPEIARVTLKEGKGFKLGRGLNVWSNVHVADVSQLLVLLLEKAGKRTEGLWNEEGLYFPENGKMSFGDLCQTIANEAHAQGYIPSASIDWVIGPKEADAMTPHGSVIWGTNAVLKAAKAKRDLGWEPVQRPFEEEIPGVVKREAMALQGNDGA